jgi:hypothetical protein
VRNAKGAIRDLVGSQSCFLLKSWVFNQASPSAVKLLTKSNELRRGRVTADRHTSAEWYLFGGCNVLVVTTFRTGILLFPLLFIAIMMTW